MTSHSYSLRVLRRPGAAGLVFIVLGGAACHSSPKNSSPYTSASPAFRDPAAAQRLTAQAAELIAREPAKAEKLLRQALAADLYHGPAHNNLGVIHLQRGELYQAASEFEWARKMMPGLPDPRMNLALTLEQAGRTEEAIKTYEAALETYPGHMPTIQALTRLQARSGRRTGATDDRLREIALRGESALWRSWAATLLAAGEGR